MFGAHLTGQPLNHQLVGLGARLVGPVKTSPDYELYTLDTVRPKPRLVATRSDGGSIAGELWLLSPANLGRLLIDLPAPMMLGRVRPNDGREVVGFGCTPEAPEYGTNITEYGSWPNYLAV